MVSKRFLRRKSIVLCTFLIHGSYPLNVGAFQLFASSQSTRPIRIRVPRSIAEPLRARPNFATTQSTIRSSEASDGSTSPKRQLARSTCRIAMMLIGAFAMRASTAFAASSTPNASTLPLSLGFKQLFIGSAFVSTFGGVFMSRIGLTQLARDIMSACVRSAAQLFLLGGFILQRLFGTTKPAVVWTWIIGVGLLAAQEASSRVEYTYGNLRRHIAISVLTSGIGILTLSLAGQVFGNIQPWYQPRTLIPVAGMLFGITLSATSLGAASLTREFATSASQVELRLARGADSKEATMPIIKTSLYSALTPTVNSLSATGIIHLPGMMSGQVLAGQSPSQAAAYQVLILFLITSTACSTVQLLARLVSHELINWKQDRLQTSELVRVNSAKDKVLFSFRAPIKSTQSVMSSWFQRPLSEPETNEPLSSDTKMFVPSVDQMKSPAEPSEVSTVFKVNNVTVQRANVQVTFDLAPGDRLGITGPSGQGKTQILRTLAGLEQCSGNMTLNGVSCHDERWSEWRRQVCWVSQDRTTLGGTPLEFYKEVEAYSTQRQESTTRLKPQDIAADWGLPNSVFDRQWSTLSGGEAQRASLAIALAFKPDVLLLDEITAGLDEATELAVERTLLSTSLPIVMVTHSSAQLQRFCTHHMVLTTGATLVKNV